MAQPKTKEDEDRVWYVGAYVTRAMQQQLKDEAKTQKRSLSQQLILILEERYATENANEKDKTT